MRRGEVLTGERIPNRAPARCRKLPGQRSEERSAPPRRRERGSAHASFELSCFTDDPEPQLFRPHRDEPAEHLSIHTTRALGSGTGPRGVTRLSYSASHRDRTTCHWYSAQLSRAAAVRRAV